MTKKFAASAVAGALLSFVSAPAVFGEGLTKEGRDRAIKYLEQTGREFVAAVSTISDAQWSFKPSSDRWSIAECAEHIAVTEEFIWQMIIGKIMKSPAEPQKGSDVAGKDELVLKMISDRARKVDAPERLNPSGRFATCAKLIQHFERVRAEEIAYLRETNDNLRSHFADHPVLKTLDAYQWLLLNGAHGERHTLQIEEVKTDYPKS